MSQCYLLHLWDANGALIGRHISSELSWLRAQGEKWEAKANGNSYHIGLPDEIPMPPYQQMDLFQ